MSQKIGYARVSTISQDLDYQLEKLESEGCIKIFSGKHGGTSKANEAELEKLIDYIRDEDVVVITRLDRLGRSLNQILQTIDKIHEKGATLMTLDGALDTSNKTAMSKAMVSLIGVFAQLERDLIADRTSEGRKAAVLSGKKMGRKRLISEKDRETIRYRLTNDTSANVSRLAKEFKVSRSTIRRIKDGK